MGQGLQRAVNAAMASQGKPPKYCPGRVRHWRIAFRTVGMRTPVCVFCGSPNPKPLTDYEWVQLIGWAEDHNVGDHVRSAIEARQS